MATAQKLSIVSANETANKTAAKKPAAKKPVKQAETKPVQWDTALTARITENVVIVGKAETARETLEMDIKKFRTYKVKLGKSRRTCPISQEFHAGFIALGVAAKTADNYLSALRISINEGKPFSLNQSRDAAKGKKASAKGKPGTTWANSGEVLEALAIAINNVKQKAGAALWEKALAMAPDGFDFAVADFLESQGETTE